MAQLVSIIIPCFNAERWIGEAIHSCLDQTYQPIEVIVIDDGSTDRSLEVIKTFGDKIRWETGPNRGGNAARNRGFALSSGEYVQFLDADDYLLPEKIARQVACLKDAGADLVYEDWQRMQENSDGTKFFLPMDVSGHHGDILKELLAGWATPPCALVFKRAVIQNVGGWNEKLSSAQDWELNIRIALAGANYTYLPGCNSVYRRPARETVSTRDSSKMHDNIISILKDAERRLGASDRLTATYRQALALSYFKIARSYYEKDRPFFNKMLGEARRLSNSFTTRQPRTYRLVASVLGVNAAEFITLLRRRVKLLK
jgi:glycosyltransferase involved in cell wall biosynthesis